MAVWPWAGYLTSLVLKVLCHKTGTMSAYTVSESCHEGQVCLCVKCMDPCLGPEQVPCDVTITISLSILT